MHWRVFYLVCILMLCVHFTSGGHGSKSGRNQRHSKNNSSPPTARLSARRRIAGVDSAADTDADADADDDVDLDFEGDSDEEFASSDSEAELEPDTASGAMMATDVPSRPYDIFTCCAEVFGSCRTSCENLSLAHLADADSSGRVFRLELKKYCPSMQLEFWSCMNRTLEAVTRGAQWSGRRCCTLGLSPRCRNACATSSTTEELVDACRQSDEQHMFACFERQEAGDRCCSNARTSECLQACRGIFEPHAPHRRTSRRRLHELCGERNHDVIQCVRNATDMTPVTNSHKYLPCCDFSRDEACRSTCRSILNSTESTDVIIGELEAGGCGTPLPHLPLWQCFLTADRKVFVPAANSPGASSSPALDRSLDQRDQRSQINEIGIDSAKLHCCPKAESSRCRRLCAQTYSTDWTTQSGHFEAQCLMQATRELELRQCIDEVDESCELGCDGLSFCTNFNNRPTELFRSCSAQADEAARSDLQMWQQRGFVSLPGIDLPIRNMTRCAPAKWLAIACALQLKPCTRAGHYNHICREDCYAVLNECMDWTRLSQALDADAICARLHPQGGAGDGDGSDELPCVSLRPYLEASDVPRQTGGHQRLTAPCKGHPCNTSEVCVARRNESSGFECIPGCSMGETSSYLVPFGAYVRVPLTLPSPSPSHSSSSSSAAALRGGFKVCRCGEQGRIEHCQPLPSFSYDNCVLPGGRSFRHGTSFYLECNVCSCYAEEITCTKKQCRIPGISDHSFTSLPCNCPTHYVPVCGRNGNTYHSACIAKCLGMQDNELEYGACALQDPCREGAFSCPAGTQCLERRQVCLSTMHRPCQQYECVNRTAPCVPSGQPVCDAKGQTHASACDLLRAQRPLAHWGACFRSCAWRGGPVCGINGVTYDSECAAWADFSLVDYRGRCREVGLLAPDMGRRCRTVKCPNPVSPYCPTVVPPGACCPICAGAFRVIYSRKQIDRALYSLRGQNKRLLTLHSVLHELDALVQIAECQLAGFLSMEVGVFVAVVPRPRQPSRIQIEACRREAEKIANLIDAQAHRITANLVLSGLTVAHMVEPTVESGAAGAAVSVWMAALGLLSVAALSAIRRLLGRSL